MSDELDLDEIAEAVNLSVGLFVRRLRQLQYSGELTLPESSALARLDRGGPASPGELAKAEQISPQGMGTTLAVLEKRGLVARRGDPEDGRRAVMSITEAGRTVLRNRRSARTEQTAQALASGFSRTELKQLLIAAPLIERLAQKL